MEVYESTQRTKVKKINLPVFDLYSSYNPVAIHATFQDWRCAFENNVNTMIQSYINPLLLQSIGFAVISPFLQSADRPHRHNLRPYHQYHRFDSLRDSQRYVVDFEGHQSQCGPLLHPAPARRGA